MRNPALETIKEVGIWKLCHPDGCPCLSFEIHHVHVDVSCRKSSGNTHPDGGNTIRVYSHSLDYFNSEQADAVLREIGEEVARQLVEGSGDDPKERCNILLEEYR